MIPGYPEVRDELLSAFKLSHGQRGAAKLSEIGQERGYQQRVQRPKYDSLRNVFKYAFVAAGDENAEPADQPEFTDAWAQSDHDRFMQGTEGYLIDGPLVIEAWSFKLESIKSPVSFWLAARTQQSPPMLVLSSQSLC